MGQAITGQEQKAMVEFAENLWQNYLKPKYDESHRNKVSFYRATVTANNGDGTLTVQAPCDTERTVNVTKELSDISAGEDVVVWVMGDGNAAVNQIVMLAYSSGEGYSFSA